MTKATRARYVLAFSPQSLVEHGRNIVVVALALEVLKETLLNCTKTPVPRQFADVNSKLPRVEQMESATCDRVDARVRIGPRRYALQSSSMVHYVPMIGEPFGCDGADGSMPTCLSRSQGIVAQRESAMRLFVKLRAQCLRVMEIAKCPSLSHSNAVKVECARRSCAGPYEPSGPAR